MRPILVVLAASLLASCASISVKTNTDPSYKGTLQKVAVISNASNVSIAVPKKADKSAPVAPPGTPQPAGSTTETPLGDYLTELVAEQLTSAGLDAQAFHGTGLELDGKDVEKRIQAYGPRQIISVNLVSGTTIPVFFTNRLHSGLFDIAVYDVEIQKVVWRGKVDLTGYSNYGVQLTSFKSMIEKVVKELKAGGLLIELTAAS